MSTQQQTARAEAVFVVDAIALGLLFAITFLAPLPFPIGTVFFVVLLVPAFGGLLFSGGVPRGLWFLLVMVAFLALFAVGGAL